tara:strand:+ start:97 stop:597 length:501 start_codon:yes stop_codon:yes gene_type:complete
MAISKIGSNSIANEDLTITDGDLVFATANKGVVLGVTSNTDGNTVDDYEEGAWTPSIAGATLSTAQGQYVKVGRLVTAHFNVVFPSSSDSSQTAVISSLPFANTGANQYGGGFLSWENAGDSGNQTIAMYSQATTYFTFVSGSTGLTLADVSTHQFLGTLVYVASA